MPATENQIGFVRDRVFVSYSHKDNEWLDKLRKILAPDIRNERVDYWDDRELQPGDPWYDRILDSISKARVAVLLVSPNFLASKFIMEDELPRIIEARNRGLTILWIPLYGKFYGPDAPTELKPITDVQAVFGTGVPLSDHDPASQSNLLIELSRQIQRIVSPARIPNNLPFMSLAGLFQGRNDAIRKLDENLRTNGAAAIVQPQAIHGLGGIGKTRLAIEYAWQHANDFTALLFVSANTPEDLDHNLAALCKPDCLDLVESNASQQEQIAAVIRWLQQHKNWLLIIDNVDTDQGVRSVKILAAKLKGGQVIITSRVTEWGRGVHSISLDVLAIEDAVALVLQSTYAWREAKPTDKELAYALADKLGGLPLAITHAIAYMQHHYQSFEAYLKDFEMNFAKLIAYHDHLAIEYETQREEEQSAPETPETKEARKKILKTIATTFLLSFDRLAPEAKAILQSAAFLAPDPIPVAMFEECADEVTSLVNLWCERSGEIKSHQTVADGIAVLGHYSLISRSEGLFSVHRMEQLILRNRVTKEHVPDWIEGVRAVLCKYAPDETAEDPKTWPVWDMLRPHAEILLVLTKADTRIEPSLALVEALGQLYFGKGIYAKCLEMDELALLIAENIYGSESNEMASRLLNYGETLKELKNYSEAEKALSRSIIIREKNYGLESQEVASGLHYLALIRLRQDRRDEAEELECRAINIYESHLEDLNEGEFCKSLTLLAQVFEKKGNLQEAETLFKRAIEYAKQGFGDDNPKTIICTEIFADFLAKKGDTDEAKSFYAIVKNGYEESFGITHPITLSFLNNYALFLVKIRDIRLNEEARQIAQIVSTTTIKLLGDTHPLAIHRRNNLVLTLTMLNKLEEARWILSANWRLNTKACSNTTTRISFLRYVNSVIEAKSGTIFLSQLKTLLTGPELPVASDIAVPWDIDYFIEYIKPKLTNVNFEFLNALIEALNDRTKISELDKFSKWRDQQLVSLDVAWPD